MKTILVKYLYGDYKIKIAGKETSFVRAATVIIPMFCLGVIASMLFNFGAIFWLLFGALIILTFPIVKSTYINWAALIYSLLIMITSFWGVHKFWEGLPFLFFSLGFFFEKTRFLLFKVKYKDLQDWEQKLNYLLISSNYTGNDDTVPLAGEREKLIGEFKQLEEQKYGANENVNVIPFLIPIVSVIIMLILIGFFGEADPNFPDIRGF